MIKPKMYYMAYTPASSASSITISKQEFLDLFKGKAIGAADDVCVEPVGKGSMALSIESGAIFMLGSDDMWYLVGEGDSVNPFVLNADGLTSLTPYVMNVINNAFPDDGSSNNEEPIQE